MAKFGVRGRIDKIEKEEADAVTSTSYVLAERGVYCLLHYRQLIESSISSVKHRVLRKGSIVISIIRVEREDRKKKRFVRRF